MRPSTIALVCIQAVLLQGSTVIDAFAAHRPGSLHPTLFRVSSVPLKGQLHATKKSNEDPDYLPAMTKSKWKKKRFLMMQDVIKLIEKRDSHAPRKAHEIVSRMQKLSEVNQDDTMKPDEQVYNVRLYYSNENPVLAVLEVGLGTIIFNSF